MTINHLSKPLSTSNKRDYFCRTDINMRLKVSVTRRKNWQFLPIFGPEVLDSKPIPRPSKSFTFTIKTWNLLRSIL